MTQKISDGLVKWLKQGTVLQDLLNATIVDNYKAQEQEVIKFITEEQGAALSFDKVDNNQFFVNEHGNLCQKISDFRYTTIALSDGSPYGFSSECHSQMTIKKILPTVTKIEF